MSAPLSLWSLLRTQTSRSTGTVVSGDRFCAKKGGGRDMQSLSAVSHTHVSLMSQGFLVIHVCEEAERQAKIVVTILLFLLFHSPSPFISLYVFPFLPAC